MKVRKLEDSTEIKNDRSRDIFDQLGTVNKTSVAHKSKKMGTFLLAEALKYFVFIINQAGTSSVPGKTPREL